MVVVVGCLPEPCRQVGIVSHGLEGMREGSRLRSLNQAVFLMMNELEGPPGVFNCDHCLTRDHRLKRNVAIVLVLRSEHHGPA